ncbi:hypothetical protein [Caenimonas koreensis]
MTQLRDARFKRALDAAPDAQLRPDARVRAGRRLCQPCAGHAGHPALV